MAHKIGAGSSSGLVPPAFEHSKRHNSEMNDSTEPLTLGASFDPETDGFDFLSKERLDDRVNKVSKVLGSDSPDTPDSTTSSAQRVSPFSSDSDSLHNRSVTPPPAAKEAFKLPLPDMEAFETSFGAVSSGPQVPKTPARQLRLDPFKLNILDMLDDEEIVIENLVVRIGRQLGAGRFSVVRLLSNGDVAKFPNDLKHTTTKKIQNDQRSSNMRYRQLCAMQEQLAAINIGVVSTTFREDGVIIQPFCESFIPTWNKETLMTDLLPRETVVLQTAKTAFAFFFRKGTPVDFRPDNIALDPADPRRLNIRDFYEMDDDVNDKFSDFVWDLLEKWARGNKAIYEYLDPRPKVVSLLKV